MSQKDLEGRAKGGDPVAAYEYGKQCIERGYEEIGRKWLQFAIDRGSVDASLELARILNLAGDQAGARKALSLATSEMHPMAFFQAGFIYLSEQDFQMAESLFNLAYENGVEGARELAEGMAVFRLEQQIENKQHLKVEAEAEKLLGYKEAKEGDFLIQDGWWINWFPKDKEVITLRLCGEALARDFKWQINQLIRKSARKENLSQWNDLVARHGSDFKAAEAVAKDPVDFQRAVGFVAANEIFEFFYLHKNMVRMLNELADHLVEGQMPNYVNELAKIYSRLNPEAIHRVLTLIAYLLWRDALVLSTSLTREAELSFAYEKGKASQVEIKELAGLREKIKRNGGVSFAMLEGVKSMVQHFSIAFPHEEHQHLVGHFPMAGWDPVRSGFKKHACTVNFRNGGWHCELPQLVEITENPNPLGPPPSPEDYLPKPVAKKIAKKVVAKKLAPNGNPSPNTGAKKIVKKVAKPAKKVARPATQLNDSSAPGPLSLKDLIDSAVNCGDLPIPRVSPGWSSREVNIGPIEGRVTTNAWQLEFDFTIGTFSGKTGATNLAERLARFCPDGVMINASLRPNPEISMNISIQGNPINDHRLVTQTFIQVANLVFDVLKEGVKTGELLIPNESTLGKYGLVQPKLIGTKEKSRNWNDRNIGGKILYNEF